MDEERKTSLEKMVATELLKLAMEMDEERKARLKKMVATTQLKLAPETEEERRAIYRLEYLSDNPIYIPNNLYLILIVELSSLIKLTRTIHFLQFIIYNACMYYVCIQILFDMYLLCMIKARIRWCTCRVEHILTLGKLLSLWFCFLLHSILFLISQTS